MMARKVWDYQCSLKMKGFHKSWEASQSSVDLGGVIQHMLVHVTIKSHTNVVIDEAVTLTVKISWKKHLPRICTLKFKIFSSFFSICTWLFSYPYFFLFPSFLPLFLPPLFIFLSHFLPSFSHFPPLFLPFFLPSSSLPIAISIIHPLLISSPSLLPFAPFSAAMPCPTLFLSYIIHDVNGMLKNCLIYLEQKQYLGAENCNSAVNLLNKATGQKYVKLSVMLILFSVALVTCHSYAIMALEILFEIWNMGYVFKLKQVHFHHIYHLSKLW